MFAVLTGDVVSSSAMEPGQRRHLPRLLKEAAGAVREQLGRQVAGDLDVFRGDSWQLVLENPANSLRAALIMRAHLRACTGAGGLDTRVAIGIGGIAFAPRREVSQGDGPAFRASGLLLEALPRDCRLGLALAERDAPAELPVLLGLIDHVVSRWTGKQALAALGALAGWPQAQIARLWRPAVKQPVVARHLGRGGWGRVAAGLAHYEYILKKLYP